VGAGAGAAAAGGVRLCTLHDLLCAPLISPPTCNRPDPPAAQARVTADAAGATVHHGVACDLCGCTPIAGLRFKSTVKSDYDVCARCRASPAAAAGEPYIPLGSAGGGGDGGGTGVQRQHLPPAGSQEDAGGERGDGLDPEEGPPEGSDDAGPRAAKQPRRQQPAAAVAAAAAAAAGDGQRHSALVRWVWDYYSNAPPAGGAGGESTAGAGAGASEGGGRSANAFDALRIGAAAAAAAPPPVVVTARGPLYLQHEGHSRTVVGVQRYAPPGQVPQWRLLILDPGHSAEAVRQELM
jgi:hypothetical protein